jgi:hypothetical protein
VPHIALNYSLADIKELVLADAAERVGGSGIELTELLFQGSLRVKKNAIEYDEIWGLITSLSITFESKQEGSSAS